MGLGCNGKRSSETKPVNTTEGRRGSGAPKSYTVQLYEHTLEGCGTHTDTRDAQGTRHAKARARPLTKRETAIAARHAGNAARKRGARTHAHGHDTNTQLPGGEGLSSQQGPAQVRARPRGGVKMPPLLFQPADPSCWDVSSSLLFLASPSAQIAEGRNATWDALWVIR